MSNPEELLIDAREARGKLTDALNVNGDLGGLLGSAHALIAAFGGLDDHLNAGGRLPADWNHLTVRLPSHSVLVAALKAAYTEQPQTFETLADRILGELAGGTT
jgi:hypothetical protein